MGVKRFTILDLRNQCEVNAFFETNKPNYVFLAAAKVGGIIANSKYKADFLYDNLMIATNIIHASYRSGVDKLLFLGSSCIYPKHAPQPIREESLLTGPLESTNDAYAIAKIAGIKLCESYREQYHCNFISGMPSNLYGTKDNYDLQNSHVLPALIRKFHEAKVNKADFVKIGGTGNVRREFLHVDDLANASVFLMENYNEKDTINIGFGDDVTIKELALKIKEVTQFIGELQFDSSIPDGTPRKLLDSSKLLNLGWKPNISLEEGIKITYQDYLHNVDYYNSFKRY